MTIKISWKDFKKPDEFRSSVYMIREYALSYDLTLDNKNTFSIDKDKVKRIEILI